MRTRGELLELEADALRFGPRELEALMPDVPLPQREILAARTHGWPVALQLARLWLTAKPDRVDLIAGFSGHTAEVAEYLTEQVLGDLPSPVHRTLEMTAPLETICAGVVEAVTGSADVWTAVISLPTLAHLVVPLDDARHWYRLHPLLADYLRDRLHQHDPVMERQCHSLASAWFEANDMVLDAVRHAASGGDINRAARLVEQTGGWELVLFGGTGLCVLCWLRFQRAACRTIRAWSSIRHSWMRRRGRSMTREDVMTRGSPTRRETGADSRLCRILWDVICTWLVTFWHATRIGRSVPATERASS